MKARRIFRANPKTAEERARERSLRDKLHEEKPSLDDLVHAGVCDPDAVMTIGMYFDVQKALQALKRERPPGAPEIRPATRQEVRSAQRLRRNQDALVQRLASSSV